MKNLPDTIPIRLAPIAGEALDSWLESYARRLRSTVHELFALAGIPVPGRSAMAGNPWTARRYPEQFAALAAASGVPVEELDAMTPARFDGTLLTIVPSHNDRGHARWWPPGPGSRFCPACLTASEGRWLLAWRLPWQFACSRHSCLLVDVCPQCGRRPRSGWAFPTLEPTTPGLCRSSLTEPQTPRSSRPPICGSNLAEATAHPLDASGPTTRAQRLLEEILNSAVEFGPGTDDRQNPFLPVLDDIYTIARSCLSAQAHTGDGASPSAVAIALAETNAASSIVDARSRSGPVRPDASATAFTITVALHALANGAESPNREIMDWLARTEMHESDRGGPGPTLKRWAGATPPLRRSVLAAVGPRLRPTEQLRYRTATINPGLPTADITVRRAMQIPAVFWRGWALRLNPGRFEAPSLRETLSTLLMLVGNADDTATIHHRLGRTPPKTHAASSPVTRALTQHGALPAVLEAISSLAVNLDEHGSPIDYTRRRRLFTTAEPDTDYLHQYFDAVGLRRPTTAELPFYHYRLREMLTGQPPQYLPDPSAPGPSRHQIGNYERSILTRNGAITDHLEDQARRLLLAHGIDEPLQWEPPFTWAPETLQWPGPAPDDIDITRLRRMLHAGNRPTEIAEALGTSLEHVRVAALRHHRVEAPTTDGRAQNAKIPRGQFPDADELRRAASQGRTIREIAEATGCSQTL